MNSVKLTSFMTSLSAIRSKGAVIRNAAITAAMRISRLTTTFTS